MLHTHFKLQRRPFPSVPAPSHYFAAESIEDARQSLVRLIERQEGPGMVIGSVGVGKSLLCALLGEAFRPTCRVVKLPVGRLNSRRSLLQAILYELGQPYRDMEEGELRLSLIDYVKPIEQCPNGVLLLVDEAENLGLALLDELRSLTNIARDGHPCFHVVLFGSPRLEEKFAHPRLESFNQRLAGRFYLEPFRHDETEAYVQSQLERSGGQFQDLFADDACRAIHQATGGIPRLINQLTDHALVLSAADQNRIIDAYCVEEAWADLQQLPAPFVPHDNGDSPDLPSDIIEFGELDAPEDEDVSTTEDAGERAEVALDTIEENIKLATVSNDWEATGHIDQELQERKSITSNEVSLIFHPAHDPFGDDFAEEEIVVDEFISASSLSQRHRRQVTSPISAELAGCLAETKVSLSASSGTTSSAATTVSKSPVTSLRLVSDSQSGRRFNGDSSDFDEQEPAASAEPDAYSPRLQELGSDSNRDTDHDSMSTAEIENVTELDSTTGDDESPAEPINEIQTLSQDEPLETQDAAWMGGYSTHEEGFVQEIMPGWDRQTSDPPLWDPIEDSTQLNDLNALTDECADATHVDVDAVAEEDATSLPSEPANDTPSEQTPAESTSRPDFRRLFSQLRASRR